ncbi:hypothetical protein ACH5RR_003331 [Cinchona calisaya]|uniref:Zinc finger, CCHC-type n=1 Tax=Cinchona calisaya TaxID=153742 RepID=A0ABD3AUK4_9GENT
MKILLTTLHVAYVLITERPKETEGETLEQTRSRQKWDNDDFICMGHILNGMSDGLFDTYQDAISAKDLWERLEARYMQEDATSQAVDSEISNQLIGLMIYLSIKAGHYKVECRIFKKKEKDKGSDSKSKDLVAMISELNLVYDDDKA